MQFYEYEAVNDSMKVIRSMTGELLYLIEGTKSAVLIDTCAGVGHLRDVVEGLTGKPLAVLLTHGHVDHAPGAAEFEEVYMNRKDLDLYKKHCRLEERKGYLKAGMGPQFEELEETDFVREDPEKEFRDLQDGDVFDLGSIQIEAIAFPGHTKGSMAFLVREMRILILGDACNNATFLFDEEASTVEEYQKNVRSVMKRTEGRYGRVFISHHVMEMGTEILQEMLDVCEDIKNGQADDLPFSFMGTQAYIAKKCNERFERADGKSANLIYNKEKIY